MNNFRIKTKRDWCIAAVLTTFVVYAVSTRFTFELQSSLLKFGNPMMTNMNQPKSYGNIMFTIETVAAFFGFFQIYLYNVNQIVSVIEEEDGRYTSIGYWVGEDWDVDESTIKEINLLCEELKPVSKKEQMKLREELLKNEDYIDDTLLIWTEYPEKWGHNFDLMVYVYEDMIFIDKGYDYNQQPIVSFFEDNGLLELVDEIRIMR